MIAALIALALFSSSCNAEIQTSRLSEGNSTCKHRTYPTNSTIKPIEFASTLSELRWLGGKEDADKYVFAISAGTGLEAGGELYRSDYYGSHESWKNITGDLPGLLQPSSHGPPYRFFFGAVAIHSSPENPEKIFVQGAGQKNWISDDFGSLWHAVDSPGKTFGFWTHFKMHPFKSDWMLALVRRHVCMEEESVLNKWCASDLFLTQDFGNTWKNLTESSKGKIASFVDFDWGVLLQPWSKYKERPADETIFATAYEDPSHMKGPLPSWDKNVHYIMSKDFFETNHEKIASCGNKFDIIAHRVYLAVPSDCPYYPDGKKRKLSAEEAVSSSVNLYVSDNEGTSFSPACLPLGDLDLGYSMVGNFFGEGAFLATHHGSQDQATARAPVANIYSAGTNSSLFSMSLGRVFRRGPHVDFVNVEGLPGIYLANELGLYALEDAAFRWDAGLTDFEKYVRSMVSYNGGAHWHLLEKPKEFTFPRCDACSQLNLTGECQLHLHGPSSWHSTEAKMPSLHSHASAPGMVMAVGNVGQFLDPAADATCTFLSRDGGESWTDIADYANVFDFGDSGGILAMVRHQTHGPTDHLQFSMDEGKCWDTIKFEEAIDVIGIRVEPTASSSIFLVHGKACEKSEWHPTCSHEDEGSVPLGKLYAINFKELMGDDWRECSDEEYEPFSIPTAERCLLGRNVTSTRRKPDAACFNGKGWQRELGWDEYCQCDVVDVECDFGYEWSWRDMACAPMAQVDINTCPDVKEKKYIISQSHLRLVNGDACANISRLINDTDGRGHSTLPGRGIHLPAWAIVVIALIAAVAVISGAAVYMQRRSPSADTFGGTSQGGSLLAAPLTAVGGALGWLKQRIPGLRNSSGDDNYFQPLAGNGEDFDVDEEDAQSPGRQG